MTKNEQTEFIKELNDRLLTMSAKKSHDYAGEDVLSNFKAVSKAAEELKINVYTPEGYALFMTLLKISRVANLLNDSKTPSNESIADSFEDGIQYFKLAYCTYYDKNM